MFSLERPLYFKLVQLMSTHNVKEINNFGNIYILLINFIILRMLSLPAYYYVINSIMCYVKDI